MFQLHPRLAADTIFVKNLELSRVQLMNDKRYPWVILVPEVDELTELHQLSPRDYSIVMEEVRQVSKVMEQLFSPKKMNVGALGNLVPQLHIHLVARSETDDAWPGPVWGFGSAQAYQKEPLEKLVEYLRLSLNVI